MFDARAAADDELVAMISRADDWSAETLAVVQAELRRRGIEFSPPPPPAPPTKIAWPVWALGALIFAALGGYVVSVGWGPRSSALFILPAAACLGMMIRRLMGR